MKTCKSDNNSMYCNCTYPCSKKGVCCDCLHYHRKMGELPACYFPEDAERTYDRSIEYFIEIVNNRGTSFLR
ncbi:MAG: DUF6485 family protein [Bacteroidales bacterium]|nr:DUF6485 family protein [Bacteroidales bacterium]